MSDHIKKTAPKTVLCAFGFNGCPCLEPDIDHIFMKQTQIECHACGAREDIPLPGKLVIVQAIIEKHEKCERKRGHNE